ncbi:MAG: hypothetical protein KME17_27115 [Cyanosarcina radialis HA8281-LM2]|nr:hypothetical protein [Cyanosarcina radialis HA8281-LM2]
MKFANLDKEVTESGVRSQESEVRSQESGVRSQESEVQNVRMSVVSCQFSPLLPISPSPPLPLSPSPPLWYRKNAKSAGDRHNYKPLSL